MGWRPPLQRRLVHRSPPFDLGREPVDEGAYLVDPRLAVSVTPCQVCRGTENETAISMPPGVAPRRSPRRSSTGSAPGSPDLRATATRRSAGTTSARARRRSRRARCPGRGSRRDAPAVGPTSAEPDEGKMAIVPRRSAASTRTGRVQTLGSRSHGTALMQAVRSAMAAEARVLVVANRTASPPSCSTRCARTMQGPCALPLLVPSTPHGIAWAADMHGGGDEAGSIARRSSRAS